jgi:prepilin-type N-terminal cleavage/methylation domain-containing protein
LTLTRRASRGFTLLEVLLAIVLIVAVIAGVYGLYASAATFRDELISASREVGHRRMLMSRLTDELSSAVVEPWLRDDPESQGDLMLQFGLVGELEEETWDTELSFVTARLPGPAAWVQRNITETPPDPESDLVLLTYRLRYDGETGQPLGLERVERKLLASLPDEPGTRELIAPDVRFFSVRYWSDNDGDWVDSWPEGGLPMAVEVVVSDRAPVEFGEWPGEYSRRVIFLPGGRTPLRGRIIRGLSPGGGR